MVAEVGQVRAVEMVQEREQELAAEQVQEQEVETVVVMEAVRDIR
jgi:hypothetical protein